MADVQINWKECSVGWERHTHLDGNGQVEGDLTFKFIPDRLAYLRSIWDKFNSLSAEEADELNDLEDWILDNQSSISTCDVWKELRDCIGLPIPETDGDVVKNRLVNKFLEEKFHGNKNCEPDLWSFIYDVVEDAMAEEQDEEKETDNDK